MTKFKQFKMRKLFLLFILILPYLSYSQVGIVLGTEHISDNTLFLNKEYSSIPDNTFVKFGIGYQTKIFTTTITVTTDLWNINCNVFIPVFKRKKYCYDFKKKK